MPKPSKGHHQGKSILAILANFERDKPVIAIKNIKE
jgi:hypothetical protein